MILYIVRHGQTEENVSRILQGHLPGNLTEEGRKQVGATAVRLAEMKADVPFARIVSSDLKRALDSASIIAEKLCLPVVPMTLLRERDWKQFTGMSITEASKRYRKEGKWVFPEGSVESEEAIFQRAGLALKTLQAQYENDALIVVTHGLFARNLIAAYFGCPVCEVSPLMNAEIRILYL